MNKINQVRAELSNFIKSGKATSVSIRGKDNMNETEIMNFDCLIDVWKSYEYDDLTKSVIDIDSDNPGTHKIPQSMLKVILTNPKYKYIIEKQ